MTRPAVPLARHLLRARDLMDRAYAEPLDVSLLARSVGVSRAHFSRMFKRTFGTPHRYLMSRRMERAMALLRAGKMSVTDVCLAGRFTSLGSFSTRVPQVRRGGAPSAYRSRAARPELERVPRAASCAGGPGPTG